MPGGMLSPTMQRISSFPFTPINKPPLSEEVKKRVSESLMDAEDCSELKEVTENSQKGEDIPALKVIIKEFAKQSMKEKENLPLNNNENMTKEKKIDNSENVAEEIEDEDPNEEGEDQTDSPGEDLDEPVSPPPSDSNHVILIEDDEEPGTNEESSNTVASGTGVAVAALIRQLLLNAAVDPIVRWEDKARGEFRVLNPGLLARRIQQANPSRPISDLRCDRGVFESVPGKQLVFRFGDLEPQISSPPRTTSSPTNVILTPKEVSPTAELPPKKLAVPQSRRKTYAQKISELQKPIPGQTVPVPSPTVKRVMPKETNLAATSLRLPSNQTSSMPSLIPLTIDDMAKKEAAAAAAISSSKGLHLSGGGVSEFPKTVPDFALPSFTPLPLSRQLNPQEIPQLDVFIPSLNPSALTDAELPLDLSSGPTKRRAGGDDAIPEDEISKKPKMEPIEKKEIKVRLVEPCKKNRAARKTGRQGSSTEEEMEELWTFCRAALHNPEYNPKVICWESIEDGEFRIVNQEEFLNAFLEVRGTRLVRDTLKKRVKACEEAELMHSRAHTRLGYRFGVKATSWRPGQGELVEQGRRMVPSKLAWTSSRFYGEFSKQTTAVKAEQEIKKEEPMDTNDGTLIEPKKADDAEPTSTSSSSSPTPPLFTLTPLVQLDLPLPAPQDKTNEEATVDVSDKEMTECEEFSCRLVLPRHRGYLAKLRLGDGLTINLDRHVFAQIEEGMREALKNKEGRSRISTHDRKIASAVIRKARRKTKAKSPKKQTELETNEEPEKKKEQEKLPESEKKEADMSSMPVLEEEGPCKELMEKTEESETTPEMQEPLSLDRDTESPPEARHRLPLVVAPRESTSSLRRPLPTRPVVSKSPILSTTAV